MAGNSYIPVRHCLQLIVCVTGAPQELREVCGRWQKPHVLGSRAHVQLIHVALLPLTCCVGLCGGMH